MIEPLEVSVVVQCDAAHAFAVATAPGASDGELVRGIIRARGRDRRKDLGRKAISELVRER